MLRSRVLAVPGLLAWLCASGCYQLVPVRLESLAPQERVRAYLSAPAAERVAEILGSRRESLDGRVLSADPEGLALLVRAGQIQTGMHTEELSQELRLSAEELEGVQRRVLDRTRTGLVLGAAGLGVGFLLYQALSGETGTTNGPGNGGPPELRAPVWQLRLP